VGIDVFFDRRALAMAVRTVRSARRSVDLEMFLIGGPLGRAVLRQLDRKARAGVRVRLLHREGLTIRAVAACKPWLKATRRWQQAHPEHHYTPEVGRIFRGPLSGSPIQRAGFPLRAFRGRGFAPLKLAHDKIIVVDDETAIVGGMNLATAVCRNCDLLLRLTGPAAAAPAAVFEYDWRLAAGRKAPFPHWVAGSNGEGPEVRADDDRLRMVVTRPDCANQLDAVRGLISGARRRIWVQMFYVTDPVVVGDLIAARARGVDVRVLCDANEFSLGLRLHGAPNLPFVEDLLRGGVAARVFDSRPGTQMHQKSIVVDSRFVFAGATNLTRQSFRVNTESAVIVDDADLARTFEDRFEQCWTSGAAEPSPRTFERRRLYLGVVRALSRFI
jgi:phosphatidylserine/phosphatidylglycerophosphate/cardiolipin synthase-like enzyme